MANQDLEKRILALEKKVTSLQEGKISDKTITGLRNSGFLTSKDIFVGVALINGSGFAIETVAGASKNTIVLTNDSDTVCYGSGGRIILIGSPGNVVNYAAILKPEGRPQLVGI